MSADTDLIDRLGLSGVAVVPKAATVAAYFEKPLAAQQAADVRAKYGPIEIRTAERPKSASTCTHDHCSPVGAGSKTWSGCTLGFPIRSATSGNIAMLAAGHCVDLSSNDVHKIPMMTSLLSPTVPNDLGPILANGWVNNSQADMAIIEVEDTAVSNYFYSSYGLAQRHINSKGDWWIVSAGTYVCRSGITTGELCGPFLEKRNSINVGPITLRDQMIWC